MKQFLNLVILLVILSDRFGYYIQEHNHILQFLMEVSRGDVSIYLYDSIMVGVGVFGIMKEIVTLPLIAVAVEVLLKIIAIQRKGLRVVKDEHEELCEAKVFLSLLIVFMHIFYFLFTAHLDKERVEILIKQDMRRIRSPLRRTRIDSKF